MEWRHAHSDSGVDHRDRSRARAGLAGPAQAARTSERRIARLFADTARTERYDHVAAEASLIDFVGSNVDNLRESIDGEQYEATVMYPTFSRRAAAAGDRRAAALFREIAFDEADHASAFLRALVRLEV